VVFPPDAPRPDGALILLGNGRVQSEGPVPSQTFIKRLARHGFAQVWAAQLRGRITDNLSLIAPRLGYFQVNQSGGNPPAGFMSAPVGLKYNFIRDVESQFLVSGGMTYFIPGSISQLPPTDGGDFHFFLAGGKRIFDSGHWLSATGFRIPSDSNWGTQLWYWSNQWDYELPGHICPLLGVNWFHTMRSAGVNTQVAGSKAILRQLSLKM
jgi:hypothetical protein